MTLVDGGSVSNGTKSSRLEVAKAEECSDRPGPISLLRWQWSWRSETLTFPLKVDGGLPRHRWETLDETLGINENGKQRVR
jgi:hypothetical protein